MHRYPAKIFPYIPIFFLASEEWAASSELVLDPFAGTGTVLLESITHALFKRNCIGVEINPLARLVAKVKTTPLNSTALKAQTKRLICGIKVQRHVPDIPTFKNIDLWFSRKVQVGLSKIRYGIEEIEDKDLKDFFLVCLSSVIRDVSRADPKIPPPIILRARNFESNPSRKKDVEKLIKKKRRANPLTYFKRSIKKNIERMNSLSKIEEISSGKIKAEIIWDDARTLHKCNMIGKATLDKSNAMPLEKGSVAIVITSPPYINAQKYLRTTKFELLWLDLLNESDLITLDRKIIGSERIFRSEYKDLILTNIKSADVVIEKIFKKDPKRAAIVSKYFNDMHISIKQINRVLRKDGHFIIVVGNNTICGTVVESHQILADIAETVGDFDIEMILIDKIRSRGMITKRHESGGLLLDEWIVVLVKR